MGMLRPMRKVSHLEMLPVNLIECRSNIANYNVDNYQSILKLILLLIPSLESMQSVRASVLIIGWSVVFFLFQVRLSVQRD